MINNILDDSERIINDIKNSNLPTKTKEDLLTILKTFAMDKAKEKSTIDSNIAFVLENEARKK